MANGTSPLVLPIEVSGELLVPSVSVMLNITARNVPEHTWDVENTAGVSPQRTQVKGGFLGVVAILGLSWSVRQIFSTLMNSQEQLLAIVSQHPLPTNSDVLSLLLPAITMLLLPFLLPLTMLRGRNHKLLFYLAGGFSTFVSMLAGGMIWAFTVTFVMLSISHSKDNIQQIVGLIMPGAENGSIAFAFLPNLTIGVLLAFFCLNRLARYDLKRSKTS